MVEWLKMRGEGGDTYLINADNITYICKDGIEFRGGGHLKAQIEVEDVERVIIEARKVDNRSEQERWLNGN